MDPFVLSIIDHLPLIILVYAIFVFTLAFWPRSKKPKKDHDDT